MENYVPLYQTYTSIVVYEHKLNSGEETSDSSTAPNTTRTIICFAWNTPADYPYYSMKILYSHTVP